jgi:hypothetical protein
MYRFCYARVEGICAVNVKSIFSRSARSPSNHRRGIRDRTAGNLHTLYSRFYHQRPRHTVFGIIGFHLLVPTRNSLQFAGLSTSGTRIYFSDAKQTVRETTNQALVLVCNLRQSGDSMKKVTHNIEVTSQSMLSRANSVRDITTLTKNNYQYWYYNSK